MVFLTSSGTPQTLANSGRQGLWCPRALWLEEEGAVCFQQARACPVDAASPALSGTSAAEISPNSLFPAVRQATPRLCGQRIEPISSPTSSPGVRWWGTGEGWQVAQAFVTPILYAERWSWEEAVVIWRLDPPSPSPLTLAPSEPTLTLSKVLLGLSESIRDQQGLAFWHLASV